VFEGRHQQAHVARLAEIAERMERRLSQEDVVVPRRGPYARQRLP
jgi:hypothetical protein